MEFPDTISDRLSPFHCVEDLYITWLDPDDFESGGFACHFGHDGSYVRSLHLP